MPKKLPLKIFLETFKYAPRAAVDILVKNKNGEIILTKRNIPPSKGIWHIPGSYVMKDEKIQECIERIARDELGISVSGKGAKLLGVFEDMTEDPRGHTIDVVYEVMVEKESGLDPTPEAEEIRLFKTLPSDIGFNHRDILNKLGFY